ncbi:MAG TPA: type III pantothenate kinase [Moraxellaceae bacterium]|nr:type III pantothenate kinase [Moraxellaceae bacterium]
MTAPVYYFDLGNTRAKFWRCEEGRVVGHWAAVHAGQPGQLLGALPEGFGDPAAAVLGISVLDPAAEARFASAVQQKWTVAPEFARAGASFGQIRNAYRDDPSRLGIDRWIGLIGGAGDCDVLCVVGCGTAITIDVLDGAAHKGGYILPGLRLMQGALLAGTQKVRFDEGTPCSASLGTSTAEAVRNAAVAAVVALVERVVASERVDRLVLTGGDADLVAPLLAVPCEVDAGLLLKGMMRYFAHRNGSPA